MEELVSLGDMMAIIKRLKGLSNKKPILKCILDRKTKRQNPDLLELYHDTNQRSHYQEGINRLY